MLLYIILCISRLLDLPENIWPVAPVGCSSLWYATHQCAFTLQNSQDYLIYYYFPINIDLAYLEFFDATNM